LTGLALREVLGHVGFEIALEPLDGLIDSNHEDVLSMTAGIATAIMPGGSSS
jgi:HEAT repeat protein